MLPVASATTIQLRIAGITARLGAPVEGLHPLVTAESSVEAAVPADFEPFGEVYQQALVAARTAPSALPDGATTWTGAGLGLAQATLRTTSLPFLTAPTAVTGGGGSAVTPTGESAGQIGGFGRLEPPAELVAFGNGQVPTTALAPIGQGGHRLHGPAATAWRSAVDAAAAEGIELRITDSYRDYHEQVDLARRKGLYSQGGLAATPGTSNHGWGLAVDVDVTDEQTLAWLRTNAWRFGFVEAVPREPWHWEFRPDQA